MPSAFVLGQGHTPTLDQERTADTGEVDAQVAPFVI
jgi:hypothetical protein